MDRQQIHRLFEIDSMIRAGRYPSPRSLAEYFEVTERTVHRDLTYLRDVLHAPLEFDRLRGGYHYTDPSFRFTAVHTFSEGELLALLMAVRLLREFRGTSLEPMVQTALDKLSRFLPDSVEISLQELFTGISFAIEPLRGDERKVGDVFAHLASAVRAHRQVRMKYYAASRRESRVRVVDPYNIRFVDGTWYLIGYCHLRRDFRIFALDRIQSLEITDQTFERDPSFAVDKYLADTWRIERGSGLYRVVLRFSQDVVPYVQGKRWHPSQQAELQPDGSLILSFQISSLTEIQRWVLSFGGRCQVLQPAELRERVREDACRILRQNPAAAAPQPSAGTP